MFPAAQGRARRRTMLLALMLSCPCRIAGPYRSRRRYGGSDDSRRRLSEMVGASRERQRRGERGTAQYGQGRDSPHPACSFSLTCLQTPGEGPLLMSCFHRAGGRAMAGRELKRQFIGVTGVGKIRGVMIGKKRLFRRRTAFSDVDELSRITCRSWPSARQESPQERVHRTARVLSCP